MYEVARSFVAGIYFLKRCDAVPETRVLLAIGNMGNDCLGISLLLKSRSGSNTGNTVETPGIFLV